MDDIATDDAIYFGCPNGGVTGNPCKAQSLAVAKNKGEKGAVVHSVTLCPHFFDDRTLDQDAVSYKAAALKTGKKKNDFLSPENPGKFIE